MCRLKFFIFSYIFLIFLNVIIRADDGDNNFEQTEMAFFRNLVNFYSLKSDVIKSEQCKIDCEIYRKSFYNKEMWAIGMFDSSSKMQSGFLSGNLVEMGDFNQCINIEVKMENDTIIRGKHVSISIAGYVLFTPYPFQLQAGFPMIQLPYLNYVNKTLYKLKLSKEVPNFRSRRNPSHRWSICVPDSCNLQEIVAHLKLYFERDNFTKITDALEQTLDSQFRLRDYDWIIISVFIEIFVLVVLQTIYDTYLHYTKTKTKHWALTAFSILSNGRRLVTISNKPELLPCLNGIRCMAMLFIVFGHDTDANITAYNYNSIDGFSTYRTFFYQVITLNHCHLDQFFMLSGFLIMYGFLRGRKLEPTFNIIKFYVRRYLRLTPSFIAAILFHISILRLMGSGPMFQVAMNRIVGGCEKNWWLSLLYISNYVELRNSCIPQAWYLCADTQLHWLSPLLLLPVVWWRKCAYYLFGLVTIVGVAIPWYIAYDEQLILNGKPSDYLSVYHTVTHCRITPWIIGHALAYFIFQNRNKKFNIPMWLVTLLWTLAVSLLAYSLFGMYPTNQVDYEYNRAYVSYYMAMSTVFYCLAMSWVIFACVFGYGGILNWFFSLPTWQILAKLTYAMFLLHNGLQIAIHSSLKTPAWFSYINTFYSFCGLFVTTLMISIVWTLSFEMPFMLIDAQVFKKNVPKSAPTDQVTLPNLTISKNNDVSNCCDENGTRL